MNDFFTKLPILFKHFLFKEGTIPIKRVCTDSRHIQKGDLFLALTGENFDGHVFIPKILDNIAGFVCSKLPDVPIPSHLTVFLVPDTLAFYHTLATEYLKTKPQLIKVALTGSSGKTSTKEWLFQILSLKYRTYKNQGNFNNLIGVPQSALEVQNEEVAIFEIGTGKPGDIVKLRDIVNPDWVIVTHVGEAHIEFFQSLRAIAREKASLCTKNSHCLAPHDILYPQEEFSCFEKIAPEKIFTSIISKGQEGFTLSISKSTFSFPFFGFYNLSNLALAVALSQKLGVGTEKFTSLSFPPLPSYRALTLNKEKSTLILDCYNANPLSMKKSLEAVSQFEKPPILVLGDMLELGEKAPYYHTELGKFLDKLSFPHIFFVGPLMKEAHQNYHKKSSFSENLEEFKDTITPLFKEPHTFFVKGSRGMHLEDIMQW